MTEKRFGLVQSYAPAKLMYLVKFDNAPTDKGIFFHVVGRNFLKFYT